MVGLLNSLNNKKPKNNTYIYMYREREREKERERHVCFTEGRPCEVLTKLSKHHVCYHLEPLKPKRTREVRSFSTNINFTKNTSARSTQNFNIIFVYPKLSLRGFKTTDKPSLVTKSASATVVKFTNRPGSKH